MILTMDSIYSTDFHFYSRSDGKGMITKDKHQLYKGRGFTLVELLVVMVIIALLTALVGPRLFPKLGKGKQSAAGAQIELIGQGLDHFRWMWADTRPPRKDLVR